MLKQKLWRKLSCLARGSNFNVIRPLQCSKLEWNSHFGPLNKYCDYSSSGFNSSPSSSINRYFTSWTKHSNATVEQVKVLNNHNKCIWVNNLCTKVSNDTSERPLDMLGDSDEKSVDPLVSNLKNSILGSGRNTDEKGSRLNEYTTRSHTCGQLTKDNVNERVHLQGWLRFKRMKGMFFVLQDAYGVTQVIISSEFKPLKKLIHTASLESIVEVSGVVALRPVDQQRADQVTGEIEVIVDKVTVLNEPTSLRYSTLEHVKVDEELRIRHRYLDIRTEPMQSRLRIRSHLIKRMRDFMHDNHFVEVETPTLLRRTPGGAREFPVATRNPGQFYALAQSPQILKQLLMVGGLDRYYQVARCYRDEGAKPDRQPEFTQLDIELSFTTREGVMKLIEDLLRYVLQLGPEPFPIMSYSNAMEQYNSDKPDTGGFLWVTDFPLFISKEDGTLEAAHHPFTMPADEKQVYENPLQAVGLSYDLVYKGNEIGGGSIRIHNGSLQRHIFEKVLQLPTQDIAYLIEALESGCPPHGGFAIGIDRLISLVTDAKTIRDAIAFPKSSDGRDLLSGAPNKLTPQDKAYYHLK